MPPVRGLVIAGTRSGCGKTSVSLGLMAACARRGLKVAPFKAGPDFIDPGLHALAAGLGGAPRTSHNLDSWMLPHDVLREIFARHAAAADLALVEGVMGLFDGFSATDDTGSTAEIARLLDLPVLLVADVSSQARSAAALVQGFTRFAPDLRFAGVVLNRAGSASHAALLRRAVEDAVPGVPVLGVLPRDGSLALASRHLGLVTAQDLGRNAGRDAKDERFARLADWVEGHLDLDGLLAALPARDLAAPQDPPLPAPRVRLGLARDRAFCFYYEENLRLLRAAGAELVEFSPLADKRLPADLGGLYLGGGYPELSAFELAQNASLRRDVLALARSGRPVYGECGGFMYLLERLESGGQTFPMCGVFPLRAAMNARFSALGYREVATLRPTPLGPGGAVLRGHEFHYSSLQNPPVLAAPAYALTGRQGPLPPEGHLSGNALGSYIHLHFGSRPEAAQAFVDACAS